MMRTFHPLPSSALLLATLVTALFPGKNAAALGFRLVDQDAFATGRGDAFVATADNPSAVYYNPAGIMQIEGVAVRGGAYGIGISTDFNGSPASHTSSDNRVQAVPEFFATWKPATNIPVAFGLGAYAPYGLSTSFPDNTPFRTLGLNGRIEYLTINPVVAVQLCRTFSLAAGPTFNIANVRLARGIFEPHDLFQFDGEGQALGFTAGAMWTPTPQHSFGLSYHSQTGMPFTGHTHVVTPAFSVPTPIGAVRVPGQDFTENADLSLEFPQFIIGGYSFRPTPNWNFEADVDWTDWDHLRTTYLHAPTTGAAIPFKYKSSFIYEFGVTRMLPCHFHLSAGYIYSENSVRDATFNPLIPDSARNIASVGIGQKFTHWNWDLSYQYAYGISRSVAQGTAADGIYQTTSNAVALSLGLQF